MKTRRIRILGVVLLALASGCSAATSPRPNEDDSAAAGSAGKPGGGGTGSAATGGAAGAEAGGGGSGGLEEPVCGDGVREPPEACDGTDLDGATCQSLGLAGGVLSCNAACSFIVTACSPIEDCNDMFDNDLDGLMDCQAPSCAGAATCSDSCTPALFAVAPSTVTGDTSARPDAHAASCNGGATGPEAIYEIVSGADGQLHLTLGALEIDADFSLSVRTACGDATSEIACANETVDAAYPEKLVVPVVAGSTYFVVVDSAGPQTSGKYSLTMNLSNP